MKCRSWILPLIEKVCSTVELDLFEMKLVKITNVLERFKLSSVFVLSSITTGQIEDEYLQLFKLANQR